MARIKLNFFGDFCVKRLNNLSFSDSLMTLLSNADMNIVNLESPINLHSYTPCKKSGPHHYQDSKVPDFLESHHFNFISLANNHAMDYGEDALRDTIHAFHSAKTIGAGSFEDAYKIVVNNINGIRIGLIAISQFEFGIIDNKNTKNTGVAWLCHPIVDEIISEAHKRCDYLFVLPHAGLERFEYPLPEIRLLYRHFISMGADGVIGSHPHIAQCWELFDNRPIIYSLGNFCFDTSKPSDSWYQSLLACITIDDNGLQFNIEKLYFDREKRIVSLFQDSSFENRLIEMNDTFRDERKYISIVNEKCLSLENYYNDIFEMSGLYRLNNKKLMKLLIRSITNIYSAKKKKSADDTHFINNIRCETHRWILSRIYELKNQI